MDTKPSLSRLGAAALHAAVPMVVPVVILGGFFFGIITATEAGAVVAAYAFLAAKLYYRNVLVARDGQDRLRERDPDGRGRSSCSRSPRSSST